MDEFDKQRTGLRDEEYSRGLFPLNETDEESERYFDQFRYSRESVPDSFSSVDNGHVTKIKNQRTCGSCVAFAAITTMETVFAKLTGTLTDYSEQEVLDCSYGRHGAKGCAGAQLYSYFRYMVENKRLLMHESFYPYQSNVYGNCPAAKPYNIGARVINQFFTRDGNEEDALNAIGYDD